MTMTGTSAESELRQLIEAGVEAIRAKNAEGSLSHHAPDVVSFDVVDPLRSTGAAAVKQRLEAWFASYQGPIAYDIRDVSITASADVAFSHSLNHVTGTTTDGTKIDMWWRATVCYRKIDGAWTITHEHSSMPFDVETGQASVHLKP